MSIRLTCRCGQVVAVASSWAGRSYPCPACQSALPVPALGILEPGTKRSREGEEKSVKASLLWFLGALLFLLVAGGGAWYTLTRERVSPEPDSISELVPPRQASDDKAI